jgi:hypothetical protein
MLYGVTTPQLVSFVSLPLPFSGVVAVDVGPTGGCNRGMADKVDLAALIEEMKRFEDMPTKLALAMDMLVVENRLIQEEADRQKEPKLKQIENFNEQYLKLTGTPYLSDKEPPAPTPKVKASKQARPKATAKVKTPKAKGTADRVRRDKGDLKAHADVDAWSKATV